jgi:dolichol-phosphate mannosyltransferase
MMQARGIAEHFDTFTASEGRANPNVRSPTCPGTNSWLAIEGGRKVSTRTDESTPSGLFSPALSVVAPCYNEQDSLSAFVDRIEASCLATGCSYEILLVNDGSSDETWERIRALAQARTGIVGVNLSRNHGHQLAVTAGLSLARGERVLLIDADLQDPPELLGRMMACLDQGYEVVYARRAKRADESLFKLVTAGLFYRVLRRLSDVDIPRDTGDFRLMSRRIVDRLNSMPERDRFIRGMVAWLGGRQTEIVYDRDARFAGRTNYTVVKMLRLAVDGITSFSTVPLRAASLLAAIGAVFGILIAIYALIGFWTGRIVPGWTSLALMTVFFGVGQFACLAIIGAYLGRMYTQLKGRPLFLIDEIVVSSETEKLGEEHAEGVHRESSRVR